MSLVVPRSPEIVVPKWYEEGYRTSIAGTQTVMSDETTRSRILLTESGLELFEEDANFRDVVGRFAVVNAMRSSFIRDFVRALPADTIRSASDGGAGYKRRLSTIYAPIPTPEIIVKTFDLTPRLALRQFDVMGFLRARLEASSFHDEVSAPEQHMFMATKNGAFKAIFMEKIDYDKESETATQHKIPDGQTRLGLVGKIYSATMPLGPFLFNDFYRQNFMQRTDESGNIKYFIIDQPQQRPFPADPSRFAVPLSNLALRAFSR